MINIVLDTNILHQEGLSSRNMKLLHRLIIASHVEIYVPEIVKREYLTKITSDCIDKIQEAHKSIAYLISKLERESHLHKEAKKTEENLHSIETLITEQITTDFDNWVNNFSVKILPFKTDCMKKVIDDYFLGNGAYRGPKKREDILDAIIDSSIKELLDDKGVITVAIKDGVFRKYLETSENICLVDSIADFLELQINKEKIIQLDALSTSVENIKTYFNSENFSDILFQYFVNYPDVIRSIYLEEDSISSIEDLKINAYGLTINLPQPDKLTNLHIGSTEHIEESTYSIKLSFDTFATLGFCAYYGDCIHLESDINRNIEMSSMNGDGMCDLNELRRFQFSGFAEVTLPPEMTIDRVKALCLNLTTQDNPVTIELDINLAKII